MTQTHTYDQGQLVSADELAEMLGLPRSTAYTLMHCKSFPTVTIGKRLYALRDQIPVWLQQQAMMGGYNYGR